MQGIPKLKTSLRTLIENLAHSIFVIQFSLMEMASKSKLGNLPALIVIIEFITFQLLSDGFEVLQVSNNYIFSYQQIPFYEDHRDPFDRFLLATALLERIPIISLDQKFTLYRPLITVIE